MARRSNRLRGEKPLGAQHTWDYKGKHEHLWGTQSVCAGQEVTHDCVIFHPTTNKDCGHTFTFEFKDKKGDIHGKVQCEDGSTFDVKATAGHILMAKRSSRKRKASGKTLGVKRKHGKLTARKTQKKKSSDEGTKETEVAPKEKEIVTKEKTVQDTDGDTLAETQVQDDDTVVPPPPTGFPNYESMVVGKAVWSSSHGVEMLMNRFLPDVNDKQRGMKSLFMAIIEKFHIEHTKGVNTKQLGRSIDFYRANGGNVRENVASCKVRWSTYKDVARLLQIMFGTADDRAQYVRSLQFTTRDRLDDRTKLSLKATYWCEIATKYNDEKLEVVIDVEDDLVNQYLQSQLSTKFRTVWSGAKLRESFRKLRATYEGSRELRNYLQSGQNDGHNFYPDFCSHNPSHVMLHYLQQLCPVGMFL